MQSCLTAHEPRSILPLDEKGRLNPYSFLAGSSSDFVDTVVPQTAIVSCWTGDRYPNDE
jgi:hypothetical protein